MMRVRITPKEATPEQRNWLLLRCRNCKSEFWRGEPSPSEQNTSGNFFILAIDALLAIFAHAPFLCDLFIGSVDRSCPHCARQTTVKRTLRASAPPKDSNAE